MQPHRAVTPAAPQQRRSGLCHQPLLGHMQRGHARACAETHVVIPSAGTCMTDPQPGAARLTIAAMAPGRAAHRRAVVGLRLGREQRGHERPRAGLQQRLVLAHHKVAVLGQERGRAVLRARGARSGGGSAARARTQHCPAQLRGPVERARPAQACLSGCSSCNAGAVRPLTSHTAVTSDAHDRARIAAGPTRLLPRAALEGPQRPAREGRALRRRQARATGLACDEAGPGAGAGARACTPPA